MCANVKMLGSRCDDMFRTPHIRVLGVGGAGCNILHTFYEKCLPHVSCLFVNTDAVQLSQIRGYRMFIGRSATGGRGASSLPELGRKSAEEDIEKIKKVVREMDAVFIICGLGGGTGTGASPVIAREAKIQNSLVISFATLPFKIEGGTRRHFARLGVENLRKNSNIICPIENESFLSGELDTSFIHLIGRINENIARTVMLLTQVLTINDIELLKNNYSGKKMNICHCVGRITESYEDIVIRKLRHVIYEINEAFVIVRVPHKMKNDCLKYMEASINEIFDEDAEVMWAMITDNKLDREVDMCILHD